MKRKHFLFAAFALLVGAAIFFAAQGGRGVRESKKNVRPGFVSTRGAQFVIDGSPFRFVGANVAVMYRNEDRARMPETLRVAAEDGIRVVRVWAYGEGGTDSPVKSVGGDREDWPRQHPFRFTPDEWNEEAFVHLDKVIAEAARNKIYVQLCLTNWWRDTGGVTQYLRWAGIEDAADDKQPFGINVERAMLFYTNEETRRMYRQHVEKIVTRRNTVTGALYKDDPAIMGYELMNEAQAPTGRRHERSQWVREMSDYIRSLDADHLITPGTWGYRSAWERREWLAEHSLPNVDFVDVHNYPRDDLDSYVDSPTALNEFIQNRVSAAYALNKPIVFGEFGMAPEGYKGFSPAEWFRAYFEGAARSGASGAIFWILTPDPKRGYGVNYTMPRDEPVRAEVRRGAELMASLQNDKPPQSLRNDGHHLVPRQFAFTRPANDPAVQPTVKLREDKTIIYRFKPEQAISQRFEKVGGGDGYIWGGGVGHVEYLVPARTDYRRVGSLIVRAHLQPVIPHDANGRIKATRITLFINGKNCGSRLVPLETVPQAHVEEWRVDSWGVRLSALRGQPLSIRFVVEADADQPFGINISNWPEGYDAKEAAPVEVEVKR
ncbi:MAG: cellulase family glycosylhydrolase [Pyrinomonadaceae bacterium]|nr:cellulase family glycosylhydrolase [Pyrinomonadaceae bacterium]